MLASVPIVLHCYGRRSPHLLDFSTLPSRNRLHQKFLACCNNSGLLAPLPAYPAHLLERLTCWSWPWSINSRGIKMSGHGRRFLVEWSCWILWSTRWGIQEICYQRSQVEWLFWWVLKLERLGRYTGDLVAAGLRATVVGWNDAMFDGGMGPFSGLEVASSWFFCYYYVVVDIFLQKAWRILVSDIFLKVSQVISYDISTLLIQPTTIVSRRTIIDFF